MVNGHPSGHPPEMKITEDACKPAAEQCLAEEEALVKNDAAVYAKA